MPFILIYIDMAKSKAFVCFVLYFWPIFVFKQEWLSSSWKYATTRKIIFVIEIPCLVRVTNCIKDYSLFSAMRKYNVQAATTHPQTQVENWCIIGNFITVSITYSFLYVIIDINRSENNVWITKLKSSSQSWWHVLTTIILAPYIFVHIYIYTLIVAGFVLLNAFRKQQIHNICAITFLTW